MIQKCCICGEDKPAHMELHISRDSLYNQAGERLFPARHYLSLFVCHPCWMIARNGAFHMTEFVVPGGIEAR